MAFRDSFEEPAGGGGGVTDHGALTGLANDDHPQYHTDARGDARYKQLANERIAERPATDAASTYPLGASIMEVATAAGWPAATGTVETLRYSDGRTVQSFAQKNGTLVRMRWWNEVSAAWSSFAVPNVADFAAAAHAHLAGDLPMATNAEILAGIATDKLISPAGVSTRLALSQKAPADAIGAYPIGTTVFEVPALTAGWPTDAKAVVVTHKAGAQTARQHYYSEFTSASYQRYWEISISNWTAWVRDSGADDMLSLSTAEVPVSAATTLAASAFGMMHVLSGTANYTVTLPPASGNAGKVIGFRVAEAATALVTLDGNASETIDGAATRVVRASEALALLCDGTGWASVIHSRSAASLSTTAFRAYNAGSQGPVARITFYKVLFPTVEYNDGGFYNAALGQYTPRAGLYSIASGLGGSSMSAGSFLYIMVFKNGVRYADMFVGASSVAGYFGASGATMLRANGTDYFEIYTYHTSTNSFSVGASGGSSAVWFTAARLGD